MSEPKEVSDLDINESVKQIDSLVQELLEYRDKLRELLSESDKKISGLYHEIENTSYDKAGGYKILVELQEQLRIRRDCKGEYIKAQSAVTHFSGVQGKIKKVRATIKKVEEKAEQYEGNKLRLIK